ncbi:hypothetical protein [Aeromicrobium sp. JJY06]|uniref:hypothetical protein n=1 Tax=Aeromicrobium sp. JJY06 TaxID=3373478 RepID=UPI00376ECF7C
MTKTEIATLVIGSGLAAGLVSGVVTLLAGLWDRRHRTKEREAIEKHEATLRRQEAHDKARPDFLPQAERLAAWTNKIAYDLHREWGGDFIYVGTKVTMPQSEEEVLDLYRHIMYRHPSKRVREKARSVYDGVNNQWSEIVAGGIAEPTFEQAVQWQTDTEELIELIHSPEPATPAKS